MSPVIAGKVGHVIHACEGGGYLLPVAADEAKEVGEDFGGHDGPPELRLTEDLLHLLLDELAHLN